MPSSEVPPASKKLSSTPTSSDASTSLRTASSFCFDGVARLDARFAPGRRRDRARRQPFAIDLAVRQPRQRLDDRHARRHHVARQRLLQVRDQRLRLGGGTLLQHHIGADARVREIASVHHGGRGTHGRMRPKPRLDLAELDAEAADLHLLVAPAEIDQRAVLRTADEVAGAEAFAAIRIDRIGDEARRGPLRIVQVAARDTVARRSEARPARRPATHCRFSSTM